MKILPIAIAALFLILAAVPTINADELDQELEIAFNDDNGYIFYKKIIVAPEQLTQFNYNFTIWESKVKEFDSDNKMDTTEILSFIEITNSLVNEIKELTFDIETGGYNFPKPLLSDGAILQFIKHHLFIDKETSTISVPLPIHLHLRRILTIGRGRAWLPLTDFDDAFIGMRFLPIFLQYTVGYAKSRWINVFPPAICVEDRLGVFNLITMGFVGLYVNFGERYINRPVGPVLLIGRQVWLRLGEDIQ
ncbi:MAG: hypothetical protein A3K77_04105 [Euryarchaeota archaeon RBG_13_31_8]|nr:MAG: hypothetical protein A3K77_04105 [Euryarchaeota archaeon RBG_13_31_8]